MFIMEAIKNMFLKRIKIKEILTLIIIMLSVSLVVSVENLNNEFLNGSLNNRSGAPIWIYDSDLYIKHVETADLNGDNVEDVIAAEYDNTYYYESSKIYAIDGTDAVSYTHLTLPTILLV